MYQCAGWTNGEKRLLLRPGFTQCRIQVPIRFISDSVLRALSASTGSVVLLILIFSYIFRKKLIAIEFINFLAKLISLDTFCESQ
jgi:hypothetical protein